ncbi:FxsA family protein [Mycobacterium celatum]|uniref:Membrane protein FxsA n=1 Tax=Mycobacterium celatum TaxID=28045 RepID=A0A1X1RVX9_MYCCE|nr:FxsA family protein [Mycobacterium celatum]ORV18551.1 hypothetical protein AWB95_03510 [Mycobacterium celatum]PIB80847.1 membrane protein FxsA [Mycobacterium celatum]
MVSRLFFVYVLVELAVVVTLAHTIGLGWTLLVLLGSVVAGTALAGSRVKRQLTDLVSGRSPVTDGALTAVGAALLVVPGLVTSAVGLLLLLPLTRTVARPLVVAMVARRIGRPLVTTNRPVRPDVIDGEVIDVIDVEPPRLP